MHVVHRPLMLLLLFASFFLTASIASCTPSFSFAAIAPPAMRRCPLAHTPRGGPRATYSALEESAAKNNAAWGPAMGISTGGRVGSTAGLQEDGCACASNSGELGIAGRAMVREGFEGVRTAWISSLQLIPKLDAGRQAGVLLGLRGAGKQVCF